MTVDGPRRSRLGAEGTTVLRFHTEQYVIDTSAMKP